MSVEGVEICPVLVSLSEEDQPTGLHKPAIARARTGMPVAAPVGWEELKEIDRADAFTVADVELLLKRASTSESDQWGKCTQSLPHLG